MKRLLLGLLLLALAANADGMLTQPFTALTQTSCTLNGAVLTSTCSVTVGANQTCYCKTGGSISITSCLNVAGTATVVTVSTSTATVNFLCM